MTKGNFPLGSAMTMTFFPGVAIFFLVLSVFLQNGFGLTLLQSGLTTVPFPIGVLHFLSAMNCRSSPNILCVGGGRRPWPSCN